ncbi:DUF6804 family protein [Pseudolysinimonas sp.]|uniref:DUF6804 family protein n=1 Tax=Pseudolysinimonas sp. TaxID=2680009 RepID=UPI00286CA42A|nr:DUF6804 family protein [Pseudolysinimonas sp.]
MPSSSPRPAGRYGTKPDPGNRRLALAPGLIAALALLIGVTVLEDGPFTVVRYVVAIFAAIVAVFAFQAKQWWWLPVFAAIAVVWNPIWPLSFEGGLWQGAQYVAALVFLLAGWFIKVPIPEDQRR